MHLDLQGKVALVTGGASGIGEAIARLFVAEGAHVVIAGRNRERGEKLRAELSGIGSRVISLAAELTGEGDCRHIVEETLRTFGRLDALVNNAGVNDSVALDRAPEDFMGSIRRNLFHVFAVTHFARDALA